MSEIDYGNKLSWAVGKKRVLCMGVSNIDCVSVVNNFPEENVHEKAISGSWHRGGSASNNCTVLRNLGVNVEFFGMLSSQPIFQLLIEDMTNRGIIVENCPMCDLDPPFANGIMAKSMNTRTLIICNRGFPYVSIEDFRKLNLNNYGWIHMRALFFDTNIEVLKDIAAFNATKEEADDKILVSVEFDHSLEILFPMLDYCDYAFFSKQLAMETGWTSMENACSQLDERLQMRWGLNLKRPYVIIMWGDQGSAFMDLNGKYTHSPPYKPKQIVDLLGTGDTFVGAFIYAKYIRDRSLKVSVDFANRIASYKITKNGYDHIANILLPPIL
ncbi:ketohexokinase [Drosophila serrata]|uniref:ketohexokinase n=2 Tax=Drosophila serrata TaxID=7274 RepID=UPI000A1D1EA9|nr:ketohexokinase [Drosophila serrata]